MSAAESAGLVRPAARQDAQAIAVVHVATWRDAYAGLMPDEVLAGLDAGQRAERWRERLAAPADGSFALVFEADGQVRGFVSGGPSREGDTGGEVYAIYVHPASQGQGAGRRLLAAAAGRLARGGFAEASLWVLAGNHSARGFYEAQGWRADGTEQPWRYDDSGPPLTEVRYIRSLGEPG